MIRCEIDLRFKDATKGHGKCRLHFRQCDQFASDASRYHPEAFNYEEGLYNLRYARFNRWLDKKMIAGLSVDRGFHFGHAPRISIMFNSGKEYS